MQNPGKASGTELPAGVEAKWAWHYRTLAALRDRLIQAVRRHEAEAEEALPGEPLDGDERSADEQEREMAFLLLRTSGRALADVEDALARIHLGTYGFCEATGAPIPAARLRAVPWCRYTREREQEIEDERRRQRLAGAGPA